MSARDDHVAAKRPMYLTSRHRNCSCGRPAMFLSRDAASDDRCACRDCYLALRGSFK